MPIFPVGQLKALNSPYCVKDYFTVNPEFGALADLRALVDAAHRRNMSVILDWVANHTAWDHSWISAHKDWYLQNAAGNIVSPPGTGWTDVAQLNYQHQDLRKAMIKAMKYWVLTANIDGFRCDYADGPPADFWKQAIDSLRGITTHRLIMMAEGGRTANFTVGFDYNFGFSYFNTLKDIYGKERPVTAIDTLNTNEYLSAGPAQRVVRYTSNHDVNGSDGTPAELFGGINGAMTAFVVTAFMKSVPMIYNGQEVATAYRLLFPFTGAKIDWSVHPEVTAEYKKVLAFRSSSAAIRRGELTSYSSNNVCAFTKVLGAEQVLVIANLRNRTITYTVPPALQQLAWKDAFTGSSAALGTSFTLQPYAYYILKP
jgi:glycosidase